MRRQGTFPCRPSKENHVDTSLPVVKKAPCGDEWCWRNGVEADCAACKYRLENRVIPIRRDTQDDNRRKAA
jgi:hypothetical protein